MPPASDASPAEPVVELRDGQSAMFGYGSLLSRRSMERTLGRRYDGPATPCALDGWRRSWDVVMPNTRLCAVEDGAEFVPEHIVYLNVRPAAGPPVNGLLYVLDAAELAAFDRREWIYDRIAVTDRLRGVRLRGGDAYVYVARPEFVLDPSWPRSRAALRRTYIDIVETGLGELGAEFRARYDASTDAVPAERLFDDVERSSRR